MPLNIEKKELTPEEKTLAEYKERVRKKAWDAASRYGWCSEVDEILADLDIDTNNTLEIEITGTMDLTLLLRIDPDLVAGLSPEEEAEVLGEYVTKEMFSEDRSYALTRIGGVLVRLSRPQVLDANVYTPPVLTTADGYVFPSEYIPRGSVTATTVHIGPRGTNTAICDSWGYYGNLSEAHVANRTLCGNCRRSAPSRGITLEVRS